MSNPSTSSNFSSSPTPGGTGSAAVARDMPWVLAELRGAVFHIQLNRPDARNPLGADMVDAMARALDQAEQSSGVRAILFSASGKAFSAGGDLGNIADRLAARPGPDGQDPIATGNRRYGAFLARLVQSPKVTMACVHGPAMGGGAGLACAVDIAVGSPSARFGFPEAGIGLVPGQILPFVSARLGPQAARRLMLTGERVGGAEAYRIGLLDYLADSDEALPGRVREILELVVSAAPSASAATKRLVAQVRGLDGQASDALARYLDQASVTFAQQMRLEAVEGVTAARERRPARWNVGIEASLLATTR